MNIITKKNLTINDFKIGDKVIYHNNKSGSNSRNNLIGTIRSIHPELYKSEGGYIRVHFFNYHNAVIKTDDTGCYVYNLELVNSIIHYYPISIIYNL